MPSARNSDARQLTALMIAPDRELARQFEESAAAARGFQILADLKSYPSPQTLDIRLRQLQPEVVLLDLATDLDRAAALVHSVSAANPAIQVIGLHVRNDSAAIVRSLRQGASEFLYAPFEAAIQEQALARIRRLIEPRAQAPRETGTVAVFASAKPGSGASTLAAQTAFALRRASAGRVLLADLDPMSGTVTFYLKAAGPAAGGVVPVRHGIDVFPAGMAPGDSLDISRLRELLGRARQQYGWILLDLPAIFYRATLLALPEADLAFLVTTPELPSLHLARKAINLLGQLGCGKDRMRVLVNRLARGSGLAPSDVQKILGATVHHSFPNDYFSLDRALAEGEPLDTGCELGSAVEEFAGGLVEAAAAGRRNPAAESSLAPVEARV
jgi:pilus assembly protein CpaE